MGPRFLNRGNIGDDPAPIIRTGASMGPRFLNRGNQAMKGEYCASVPGFNGAAVSQPRKCPPPSTYRPDSLPASMGPRFLNRGNFIYQLLVLVTLQASMGPRFLNRGNPSSSS